MLCLKEAVRGWLSSRNVDLKAARTTLRLFSAVRMREGPLRASRSMWSGIYRGLGSLCPTSRQLIVTHGTLHSFLGQVELSFRFPSRKTPLR